MKRKLRINIFVDDNLMMTVIAENEEVEVPLLTTFTKIKNGGGIEIIYRNNKDYNIIEYHLNSDSLDTILSTIGY